MEDKQEEALWLQRMCSMYEKDQFLIKLVFHNIPYSLQCFLKMVVSLKDCLPFLFCQPFVFSTRGSQWQN